VATYVFVDDDGKLTPITHFIDVDGFFGLLNDLTEKVEGGGKISKTRAIAKITKELPHLIDLKNKPKNLDIKKLLLSVLKEGDVDALADFSYRTMLIGCMHFQDPYNFDIERVKRCAIHYAVPGGKVYPFCTYNSIHREKVAISALMTTSMMYMEPVIKKLKENFVKAKVVVGGAPINNDFANKIGADGYGKDAVEAVKVSKKLVGV
jgi:uncharacterized radical SAM superfamily Fe-S cluster-containing enzyme